MDGEQARSVTKNDPYTFNILHLYIPLSHAPGPQSFLGIRNQPDWNELKLNQQGKGKD